MGGLENFDPEAKSDPPLVKGLKQQPAKTNQEKSIYIVLILISFEEAIKNDTMKNQTKNFILTGLVLLSIPMFMGCAQKEVKTPPNVIYIFPDQYPNYSLGFWSQDDNKKYL